MSAEENKAVVRRYFNAVNAATANGVTAPDTTALDDLLAPELATHTRERLIPNVRAWWGWYRGEIRDMVAEGDKVWVRVFTSGGHTGEWRGLPPTGTSWTNRGVLFMRLAGGKIVEHTALWDDLNMLQQLGGTITPRQAGSAH